MFYISILPECVQESDLTICSFPYSSTTSSNVQHSDNRQLAESNQWLDNINSPLIQDEGDGKSLKLRFDVSKYAPEEIVVKTVDNKLLVSPLFGFPMNILIASIFHFSKFILYF